ncbi:MAG: NAD(+) diphosphatase [Pseudomonadales bacterium]|nr:NAD(+) diphosphatase [Pseudomonadales bacterium]
MEFSFTPGVNPPQDHRGDAIWFAFQNGRLLMFSDTQGPMVPQAPDFDQLGVPYRSRHFLGHINGQPCFAVELDDENSPAEPFFLQDMRRLAMEVGEELFMLAGRALQVIQWHRDHQFCGRCGAKTTDHDNERAKVCSACGHTSYPRISPCIIVLITRGEEILLGRSPSWPRNMFSTLAGFVEPGETLEQAVHREIYEEVGISVKNLEYQASQPWPFPHSLMIGYFAEYDAGQITVDGEEISEAHWFPLNQLPNIPPSGSISRYLIDNYLEKMARFRS